MFNDETSPLSKRRKFTPPQFSIIPSHTNEDIANHTFGSPVLAQMSAQAPSQAEIEQSLLQVGMRVRKSVSDGYQSPQKKSFTPQPFSNRLARLSPETQQALLAKKQPEPEPYSAGGLHNVGGLAMQPLSTATFCGISLAALSYYSEDCTNTIAHQQLWTYTTSHKRRTDDFDSDSDESSQDWQPETPTLHPDTGASMPMDYFNIGSENLLQTGDRPQQMARGRKVAKPKSRVRQSVMTSMDSMPMPPSAFNPFENLQMQTEPQHFGFSPVPEKTHCHRRIMSVGMEETMTDFEDASFLQRREDVDMDCS